MTPPSSRRVTLAVIIGAHGVGGAVRLKVFSEQGLAGVKAHKVFNDGALALQDVRDGPNGAIARLAGVGDRTAAEALRGTELWVPRTALPPLAPGEYYHADLIGLAVVTPAGDGVGMVVAIDNFGAGDVIEIEKSAGGRFMVPMRQDAVPEWDEARLVIDPAYID